MTGKPKPQNPAIHDLQQLKHTLESIVGRIDDVLSAVENPNDASDVQIAEFAIRSLAEIGDSVSNKMAAWSVTSRANIYQMLSQIHAEK